MKPQIIAIGCVSCAGFLAAYSYRINAETEYQKMYASVQYPPICPTIPFSSGKVVDAYEGIFPPDGHDSMSLIAVNIEMTSPLGLRGRVVSFWFENGADQTWLLSTVGKHLSIHAKSDTFLGKMGNRPTVIIFRGHASVEINP